MIHLNRDAIQVEDGYYLINRQQFPRVSAIIQEAGLYTLEGPQARIEYARDRGSKAHKACALFDQGVLDWSSVGEAINPYVQAWKLFCLRTGFKAIHCETTVVSGKYQYAGTLDVAGAMGGRLVLIDRKCTAIMPKSTGCQLWAYLQAYNEDIKEVSERAKEIIGVNLRKDGTYQVYPYRSSVYGLTFISALNIYNFNHRSRL